MTKEGLIKLVKEFDWEKNTTEACYEFSEWLAGEFAKVQHKEAKAKKEKK